MTINEYLQSQNSDFEKQFYRIRFTKDSDRSLENEQDKKCLNVLRKIGSLAIAVTDNDIELKCELMADNWRSFSIEDLTKNDYALLQLLDLEKTPVNLRARAAYLLWYWKKNCLKYAHIAINAYYSYYELFFDEQPREAVESLRIALRLSLKINDQKRYTKYFRALYDCATNTDSQCRDVVVLSMVEVLSAEKSENLQSENKQPDWGSVISVLDRCIDRNKSNLHLTEKAFNLKHCIYQICKDDPHKKEMMCQLANYLASFADNLQKAGGNTLFLNVAQ